MTKVENTSKVKSPKVSERDSGEIEKVAKVFREDREGVVGSGRGSEIILDGIVCVDTSSTASKTSLEQSRVFEVSRSGLNDPVLEVIGPLKSPVYKDI